MNSSSDLQVNGKSSETCAWSFHCVRLTSSNLWCASSASMCQVSSSTRSFPFWLRRRTLQQHNRWFRRLKPNLVVTSARQTSLKMIHTWWISWDYSWETQASEVCAKSVIVILAHELSVDFRDAVNCFRPLNRQIWCRISRRVLKKFKFNFSLVWDDFHPHRSKCSNRRWYEDSQLVLFRQLNHVVQSFNIDAHSQRNILLSNGTQQGRKVNDPINAVRHDGLLQSFKVQDVSEDVWALFGDLPARLDNVRQNHILLSVLRPQ